MLRIEIERNTRLAEKNNVLIPASPEAFFRNKLGISYPVIEL